MIIQVLFLFASCINFKDFHFETSSVYYKISYTYVILVQNFGQLYFIVLMQSAYSGFGCFCLFSALQSQDEELIFFSSEKLLRQQQQKKMANTSALQNEKRNHLIKFIFHPSVLCSYPLNSLIRLRALLT